MARAAAFGVWLPLLLTSISLICQLVIYQLRCSHRGKLIWRFSIGLAVLAHTGVLGLEGEGRATALSR